MKIRTDFVSNSSSSSFVVAINPQYDTFDFCKDIAEATVNPDSSYHDNRLQKLNEINLSYCLENYSLLYLGQLLVSTKEQVIRKADLPVTFEDSGFEFDIYHWNNTLKLMNDWKKVKDNPSDDNYTYLEEFSDSWLDKKTMTLHDVSKRYESGVVVDFNYDSNFYFKWNEIPENLREAVRDGTATSEQLKDFDKRMTGFLEYINKIVNDDYSDCFISSYKITMDTIRMTRNLLLAGCKMKFEKWENIDKIEERLKKGEKLFMIRVNNSGDGYLKDGVYCEDDAPLEKVDNSLAMEYLYSECG